MEQNSILDVILEKSANVEQATNSQTIQQSLNEIIKIQARREKTLRKATITLKSDDAFQAKEAAEMIEKKWTQEKKQAPATYWADKSFVYIQFITATAKNQFLDFQTVSFPDEFKKRIQRPNLEGEHITRKPIKIEIPNVRMNIKADKVQEIINNITKDNPMVRIEDFREGKPNQKNTRSILFKINSEAFKILFGIIDGALPYVNTETNSKTRLFMRINCKPWTCRDCFAIGKHTCEGKVCANCGVKGHLTKDCKQKTKYCNVCKRKGHRAKDPHCPTYLGEVGKEIRKMDFPLEFFEEKELRLALIKNIQLK